MLEKWHGFYAVFHGIFFLFRSISPRNCCVCSRHSFMCDTTSGLCTVCDTVCIYVHFAMLMNYIFVWCYINIMCNVLNTCFMHKRKIPVYKLHKGFDVIIPNKLSILQDEMIYFLLLFFCFLPFSFYQRLVSNRVWTGLQASKFSCHFLTPNINVCQIICILQYQHTKSNCHIIQKLQIVVTFVYPDNVTVQSVCAAQNKIGN